MVKVVKSFYLAKSKIILIIECLNLKLQDTYLIHHTGGGENDIYWVFFLFFIILIFTDISNQVNNLKKV